MKHRSQKEVRVSQFVSTITAAIYWHRFVTNLLQLSVKHEVNAGKGSVADQSRDEATAEASDPFGQIDLSEGTRHLFVAVPIGFEPGEGGVENIQ